MTQDINRLKPQIKEKRDSIQVKFILSIETEREYFYARIWRKRWR